MRIMPNWWVTLFFLLSSWTALANPISQDNVPDNLKPWIPWVLDNLDEYGCSTINGAPNCLWPGQLALDLNERGGKFIQKIQADNDVIVPLVGDSKHWPQNVRANNKPAVILNIGELPVLFLTKGEWTITGDVVWREMPEGIRVPPNVAIVALKSRGVEISHPQRDENSRLWLQSNTDKTEEGERLDLEVYRKITDGVPLLVSTEIILRASGKAREINLGPVLLDGNVIMSINAQIPARIDKDGHLRTQIHAGTHKIEIIARTLSSPKSLSPIIKTEPWPKEEIWVWQSNEVLRQVTLSGVTRIDPSRTNLPQEWSALPAYLVRPDDSLTFSTTRRGEPDPAPDDLRLGREIWMDLSGDGYTVRDTFTGSLSRTWRLDLEAGELGRASLNGTDQLITENPKTHKPGIEIREGNLNLKAEWKIKNRTDKIPAVAWSTNVQQLATVLHTPPGWTLLSASGVDHVSGTWLDKWDLFTVFFILLVAMTIAKLTKWYLGIVALGAMILTFQESAAPFIEWVFLLVFLALLKALPQGKLYLATKVCWWLTVVALISTLVPFSVEQIRTGIYPQIGDDGNYYDFDFEPPQTSKQMNEPMEADEVEAQAEKLAVKRDESPRAATRKIEQAKDISNLYLETDSGSSGPSWMGTSTPNKYRSALQQDPEAIIQTGPGVPYWKWKSWELSWSGPVEKTHTFKLNFISPTWNLVLSLLRVILLIFLSIKIIQEFFLTVKSKNTDTPNQSDNNPKKNGKAASAVASLLVILSLFATSNAAAQTPDPSILSALQEKLTRLADCEPNCISTSTLSITATDTLLKLQAEVHAGTLASFKIPGPAGNWVPNKIVVDGKETSGVMLHEDGFIHVRLDKGAHTVKITGRSLPSGSVTLEFGDLPHLVTVTAPGWNVEGLRKDGKPERSVQLTKIQSTLDDAQKTSSNTATPDNDSYPPWLEITRTLDLGIPWLVHTTVRRVSPIGTPVIVKVPLLPGESVTESSIQVENEKAMVSLGRDDTSMGWSSTLKEQSSLRISAPKNKTWSEVWNLKCSPIWQCKLSGLTPTSHKKDGSMQSLFRPWPGEYVDLKVVKLGGMTGQSSTIDSAYLKVTPGTRLLKASLKLAIRTSTGGIQTITLPPKATVQTLQIDGADKPFRQKDDSIEISLKPGHREVHLNWQQPGGISVKYAIPQVSLGGPCTNAIIEVELPSNRWLLWLNGPSWGPAILYWGFLIFILFAATILGFLPLSPLNSLKWALLLLGLTQVPVGVAFIIVGWFFVLAWRKRKPLIHPFRHNSLQVIIGLWTFVAACCLIAAVYAGLAVQPDMQIDGTVSSNTNLVWYMDRVKNDLPTPIIWSVNIYIWKGIMLTWAMWLAWSLIKWGPWGWRAFSHELLWRESPRKPRKPRKSRKQSKTLPSKDDGVTIDSEEASENKK